MLKCILKITILINVFLITNVLAVSHSKQTKDLSDVFISEFVKSKNNPKIDYDGKTLTLYTCSSPSQYAAAIILIFFFGAFEIACLSSNDKEAILVGAMCSIIFGLLSLIGLCINLYYDLNDIPIIAIDDDEIRSSDGNCIKWKNVDRLTIVKTYNTNDTTSAYVTIKLCDKFLNSLFTISKHSENLPVSADNLYALLEYYLKKSKARIG